MKNSILTLSAIAVVTASSVASLAQTSSTTTPGPRRAALDMIVTNSKGAPFTGLDASSFSLFDQGEKRNGYYEQP